MSEARSTLAEFTGRAAAVVVVATMALVAVLLMWRLAGVWILLFAATLFGVALRTASSWLSDRSGMPLSLALVLWIVLGTALLGGFLWFVAASLISQFADLTDRIPIALEAVRQWALDYAMLQPVVHDIEAALSGGGAGPDTSTYLGRAIDASRVTLGTLGNLLVMTVLAVYMALDLQRYSRGTLRLVPAGWRDTARELLDAWRLALPWWLAARLASMLLVALLVSAGLMIAGVPLPLVLGLIAGLFSFVPFLGPIASVVPAILVALTDSPASVVYVLVVFGIVQVLESYIITPLIERKTVSVPLFPLIAAQLVAGSLLGIAGVIFATPLLLTLTIAVQVVYQKRILGEPVELWGAG